MRKKKKRYNFAKAITVGRRSESGKILNEFYDKLVLIWGGSPTTQPLRFGVSFLS